MSLKNKVFSMSIAQLGFRDAVSHELIKLVLCPFPGQQHASYATWSRKQITVGQIVDAMGPYKLGFRSSSAERKLIKELAERGLTRLDWACLPAGTVTLKMLQALPKEELLELPALILGTLSGNMLSRFLWAYHNVLNSKSGSSDFTLESVTVADVLYFNERLEDWRKETVERDLRNIHWKQMVETRELLKKLGISDDLYFMRFKLSSRADSLLRPGYQLPQELEDQLREIAQKRRVTPEEVVVEAVRLRLASET